MSVLKYKDNLGNWVSIPTIKGDKGDKGDAGTTSWSGITDKPTTIAGFGITDAYTKTETDTLLGAKADTSTTYTKTETDTALATKESTTNKVTALSSASTDTQYPSAKCVYDYVNNNKTFVATYGTTTYADIMAAKASGRVVICVYNNLVYVLQKTSATWAEFKGLYSSYIYTLKVTSANAWTTSSLEIALMGDINKKQDKPQNLPSGATEGNQFVLVATKTATGFEYTWEAR